jgi:hypothetical protein
VSYQEILTAFYRKQPKWDVRCNDSLILTNAPSRITVEILEGVANRISRMLAVSGDYTRAFSRLWERYPQYKTDAAEDILVTKLNGDEAIYDNLVDLMENSNVLNLLPINSAAQAKRREENERARQIAEITEGKTQYKHFDGRYGTYKYYDSSHLETETDERVAEIHQLVMSQRNLMAAPPSKPTTQQQQQGDVVLINPNTGIEFTRKELIAYINSGKHAMRALLVGPDGRQKPGVADAVTRILKGQA